LDWGAFPPGFLYSPFTAVDEKIPLSMVQVNSKPQYLVFSSHSQLLLADSGSGSQKIGQFCCGKRKQPCQTRLWQVEIASNPVQSWPAARSLSSKQAYAPADPRTRRRTGAISNHACGSCGQLASVPGKKNGSAPLSTEPSIVLKANLKHPASAIRTSAHRHIVQRKRRPLPGGASFDSQNQESIA